jgi:hypothetical protein
MALIPCRECGEGISTKAPACPKCGAPPIEAHRNYLARTLLAAIVMGAAVWWALSLLGR